jgi:hypothetical protein
MLFTWRFFFFTETRLQSMALAFIHLFQILQLLLSFYLHVTNCGFLLICQLFNFTFKSRNLSVEVFISFVQAICLTPLLEFNRRLHLVLRFFS